MFIDLAIQALKAKNCIVSIELSFRNITTYVLLKLKYSCSLEKSTTNLIYLQQFKFVCKGTPVSQRLSSYISTYKAKILGKFDELQFEKLPPRTSLI